MERMSVSLSTKAPEMGEDRNPDAVRDTPTMPVKKTERVITSVYQVTTIRTKKNPNLERERLICRK